MFELSDPHHIRRRWSQLEGIDDVSLHLVPDTSLGGPLLSLVRSIDHEPRFECAARTGGDGHGAAGAVGSKIKILQKWEVLGSAIWVPRWGLGVMRTLRDLQLGCGNEVGESGAVGRPSARKSSGWTSKRGSTPAARAAVRGRAQVAAC